ncbi:MAG: deoxyribodipyrimidine photo-lyase [Parashewanella sp.]
MDIEAQSASNALMWFRNDLRVTDNQALSLAVEWAAKHNAGLEAVYFQTPNQWQQHDVAPIQLDFIERHLNLLGDALAKIGIKLRIIKLDRFDQIANELTAFCRQHSIKKIFAGAEPEWNEIQRDKNIASSGLAIHFTQEHCLLEPLTVKNQSGQMFKVFTPFKRRWREIAAQLAIYPLSKPTTLYSPQAFKPIILNCEKISSKAWPAGESAAQQLLNRFSQQSLARYKDNRDFPALNATSQLSPYLAIGVLSPRQCFAAILAQYPSALVEETDADVWLNELIWREFYRHLLVAFPRLSKTKNFNSKYDVVVWRNDPHEFQLWCEGKTGYPIIDAAMRQLNQTGWMHNRLRMITASFLTKHLLIDWRWGERYFRQHLIDGDLAANNGGWQWSAGTGCDAQPYFRIFNPMEQSKKFDANGDFIRHFLPELIDVPAKKLHQSNNKTENLIETNYSISKNYPVAIVEHKFARARALEAFAILKSNHSLG